jgi:hypothetical protein
MVRWRTKPVDCRPSDIPLLAFSLPCFEKLEVYNTPCSPPQVELQVSAELLILLTVLCAYRDTYGSSARVCQDTAEK